MKKFIISKVGKIYLLKNIEDEYLDCFDSSFNNVKLSKNFSHYFIEEEVVNLIYKTPPYFLYSNKTLTKSKSYQNSNRLTEVKYYEDNKVFSCISIGTNKYKTSFQIKDNEIYPYCSCPVIGNCKHSAALYSFIYSQIKLIIDKLILDEKVKNIDINPLIKFENKELNTETIDEIFNLISDYSKEERYQLIIKLDEYYKEKNDTILFMILVLEFSNIIGHADEEIINNLSKKYNINKDLKFIKTFVIDKLSRNYSLLLHYYEDSLLCEDSLFFKEIIIYLYKREGIELFDYMFEDMNHLSTLYKYKHTLYALKDEVQKYDFYKLLNNVQQVDQNVIEEITINDLRKYFHLFNSGILLQCVKLHLQKLKDNDIDLLVSIILKLNKDLDFFESEDCKFILNLKKNFDVNIASKSKIYNSQHKSNSFDEGMLADFLYRNIDEEENKYSFLCEYEKELNEEYASSLEENRNEIDE